MNDLWLIFIVWLLNLELNPGLGNIWWRTTQCNTRSFSLTGIIQMFTAPFFQYQLWLPRFWDVNPWTFFVVSKIIVSTVTSLMNKGESTCDGSTCQAHGPS